MEIDNLLQKLRYKNDLNSSVINAPKPFEEAFNAKGIPSWTQNSGPYQFTILFVIDRSELEKLARPTIESIEYDSVFWIAYPKGSSSMKSDINRNSLFELLKPYGHRPVSQVAIDNDWSALRFRPIEKVKSRS
ncbi:hypothetical protein MJD09_24945 [bacterium]|nr:hypothetical protein [bacterium]